MVDSMVHQYRGLRLAINRLGCPVLPSGSVKANKYRRFSASNPAERGGNSPAKTAQL
jgi:hypothetical protein